MIKYNLYCLNTYLISYLRTVSLEVCDSVIKCKYNAKSRHDHQRYWNSLKTKKVLKITEISVTFTEDYNLGKIWIRKPAIQMNIFMKASPFLLNKVFGNPTVLSSWWVDDYNCVFMYGPRQSRVTILYENRRIKFNHLEICFVLLNKSSKNSCLSATCRKVYDFNT